MILYQYRGSILDETRFSYLEKLVKSGSLKFSSPSEFNDPFDCLPTQVGELPVGKMPHFVADQLNMFPQSALSHYIGVACFTPHPDKMLMWSHYGDQHKGVCVGFDSVGLFHNMEKNSEGYPLCDKFKKIEYTAFRPREHEEDFIYKKSLEWRYEDEYRLVSTCRRGEPEWGPGVWNVPVTSIKEIVLGARMDATTEEKVKSLVIDNRPDITIKKSVVHSHTFDILIEKMSDVPNCKPMSGAVHMPSGKWKNI